MPGRSNRAIFCVFALVGLSLFAAYANSFRVPYLLDDDAAIEKNGSIKDLRNLGAVLSPRLEKTTAGRPLLNLSFAVNYAWSGLDKWSYHLVNLLIHAAAAGVLIALIHRSLLLPVFKDRYRNSAIYLAGIIGAVWALHPVQTISVTYISQRAEAMMGLCYFLTLYGFVRSLDSAKPLRWKLLSVGACFCGMATKEVMITAPFVVLLFDRALVGRSFGEVLARRAGYYFSLATSWMALGALMASSRLGERGLGFNEEITWLQYALSELKIVVLYAKLSVWPSPLVFDYGPEFVVKGVGEALPYMLIILAAMGGIVWLIRRGKFGAAFLAAAFFVVLSPTSSVVPIRLQPMAESRMYVPMAALLALLVLFAYERAGRMALAAFAAIALACGVQAFHRNGDYSSALGIWNDTVTKGPPNTRARINLGLQLMKLPGRVPEAIQHYETALRIRANVPEVHSNLADALADTPGREAESLKHYEEALRLAPDRARVHTNFGMQLQKTSGRQAEAIEHFEKAVQLDPQLAEAHNNLAVVLVNVPARVPEALSHFAEAMRLNPDYAQARLNYAAALARLGRKTESFNQFEELLRVNPNSAELHYAYARTLSAVPERRADAFKHYEAALKINPNNAVAHNDYANDLCEVPGRMPDAFRHYEEALRINPNYTAAHANFAIELMKFPERRAETIAHFEAALRLQPTFEMAALNLADLHQEGGRAKEAIDWLNRALAANPASTKLRQKLDELKGAAGSANR